MEWKYSTPTKGKTGAITEDTTKRKKKWVASREIRKKKRAKEVGR